MDGIEIKLLMSFMTDSGRKVSLFVTDPREDVTETEIKEVMDLIIEKNIFAVSYTHLDVYKRQLLTYHYFYYTEISI